MPALPAAVANRSASESAQASPTIYLDNLATTPVDPRVLEAMLPYFTERFGNAASTTHDYGLAAAEAVEGARQQIAALIGASPREVILTSEMYRSKTGTKKGIAAVQTNAADRDRYDRRSDKRKQHYFVLKAANHRIIGCSESYSGTTAMEKGIKSVMKNGTTTKISDTTE